MRSSLLVFLPILAACVSTETRPPDDFVRAADSWRGLHLSEMIGAWGEPDSIKAGTATWRLGPRSARCIDPGRRRAADGNVLPFTRRECTPVTSFAHKCTVTVGVDRYGEIHDVSALSYRCSWVYADYIRLLDSGYPYNLYKYGEPLAGWRSTNVD